MLVLGIESTAHTFGVDITNEREILTNERGTIISPCFGLIPREADNHKIYKFIYIHDYNPTHKI